MTESITAKLNPSEKRTVVILRIGFVCAFIIAAFLFWDSFYNLCNIIGAIVSGSPDVAIRQLLRMLPLFLTTACMTLIGLSLLGCIRRTGDDRRSKFRRALWGLIVLGFITALYVAIGCITGTYRSIVEHSPAYLYPLDCLIFGAAVAILSVIGLVKEKSLPRRLPDLPSVRKTHFQPAVVISYLVALAGFAACFHSIYAMDWTHGYIFFNIALLLNYASPVVMLCLYLFLYTSAPCNRQSAVMKRYGLMMLIVNIALLALYMIAVEVQNEAPNQNAFGLLPIEFTASFHAFPFAVGLSNLLTPLVAFLLGLKKRDADAQ